MFNTVTLIGYLGSDAESRPIRNNSPLRVLSLATKRTWKNRETGESESQTTWHTPAATLVPAFESFASSAPAMSSCGNTLALR